MSGTDEALNALRAATVGTKYEGHLYLVGGFVRDRVMGIAKESPDIDLVLEGDALELAGFLWERGVSTIHPVVYPRFGTAMVQIAGHQVELVTARVESYAPDSRKPEIVEPGTILDDARRRDFTINTLLENLQTGEIVDPLGKAFADIEAKIIRTPLDPDRTFADDPLRMLRAVRFACRFDFALAEPVRQALFANANRLAIISRERIRDEFSKMLLSTRPSQGLEILRESGLLAQFAPELLEMAGVTQNNFHHLPVWEHTLSVIDGLPSDANLTLRLAALLHDIGKPRTRSVDPTNGKVHFYEHQRVSAVIAREILLRLKFSNQEIDDVVRLVAEHMRIGEYSRRWSTGAVRRLMRDLGPQLEDLFVLHAADVGGLSPEHRSTERSADLRKRIEEIGGAESVSRLESPLTGQEIMTIFTLPEGRSVGVVKSALVEAVVDGRLRPDDRKAAIALARKKVKELKLSE